MRDEQQRVIGIGDGSLQYISGSFALNLPCSLEKCDLEKVKYYESYGSLFGNYGIHTLPDTPESLGVLTVANTIRALLDLFADSNFHPAKGHILEGEHRDELFDKVYEMRNLPNWCEIVKFLDEEYGLPWMDFLVKKTMGER